MINFFSTPLSGDMCVPADATAMLVIIHGLAEHRARYDDIAAMLATRGIATCRFDQRGHGKSVQGGEMRGDAVFDDFLADVVAILNGVRATYASLPIFVWGHSMGAVIATLAVAAHIEHRPRIIKGVITSGPPLAAFDKVPRLATAALKLLSRLLPKRAVPLPFRSEYLSRDPQVGIRYAADPLIAKAVSLRLLVGLSTASLRCPRAALKLSMPWLVMHGSDDRIAPPIGSQRLFDNLRSRDKEFVIWPAARHEIHNELEPTRSEFLAKIVAWIHQRATDGG